MDSIKFKLIAGLCSVLIAVLAISPTLVTQAQQPNLPPVPTLVPPTRVPTATPLAAAAVQQSGVYTMQQNTVLRVGARYNLPPFSYLDNSGAVTGYEAEIVQAIANELAVTVEWVQTTGENELDLLLAGEVDVLIGQQVHTREAEQFMEFVSPYYLNKQMMVVMQDSAYQEFNNLAGQPVGVVMGSRGAAALPGTGVTYDVRSFLTESDALDALQNGEVQAMVGQLDTLARAGRQRMRLITQPVRLDPYAIAVRRHDVNLRNILERSLQRLKASGRIAEIFNNWFPDEELDFDVLIPVYDSLYGDTRSVASLNWDVPIPTTSVLERIFNGEPLLVAGLSMNPEAPAIENQLDPFNQALVDEMARRWGVTVQYLPNSAATKLDLLFSGQAMLAVGVTPVWDGADRFDYSRPYAEHGNRILVLEGSRFGSIMDFRGGTYLAYWYEDPGALSEIERITEELGLNPSPFELRSIEQIVDLFNLRTIHGIFGDTFRLQHIVEETRYSGLPFVILDRDYSLIPMTFALPRNDADFRSLVDWTMQEMFLDGTYRRIYNETFGLGEPLVMLTWSGDGGWLRE